jgi:hypothetical protein
MAIPDRAGREVIEDRTAAKGELGDISFVSINNPFHRALLLDVTNIYRPGQGRKNQETVSSELLRRERRYSKRLETSFLARKLTGAVIVRILIMYLKFLFVYAVVMGLTYYGVVTLGTWLFVYRRRTLSSCGSKTAKAAAILRRFFGAALSMLLFCPAYVIAYSIRTELNTDTVIFMIILGVISNGLLIVYSARFQAFLEAEARKGYVDTAIVKNLNASWGRKAGGIRLSAILNPVKRFDGHILEHIFRNAEFQYLSTFKEQASFLVTGLIIIEMALNIHGHLCYEMLQEMMYGNYDIVIVIILLIFYTIKLTEIAADTALSRRNAKYDNRAGEA